MSEQTTTNGPATTATPHQEAINGTANQNQYAEPIGPKAKKPDNSIPYGEGIRNSVNKPFNDPAPREKKDTAAPEPGITGKFNGVKKAYEAGTTGNAVSAAMPAEIKNIKDLHAERAATTDKVAIKAFDDRISEAAKAVAPKAETEFNKLGMVQQTAAKIGGNLGQAGAIEKGVRFGGAAVGLGAIISGTKQLISPEVDENGESKSGVGKQLGKIAGGAAIVYASLVHGGANKAMGLVRG